MASSLLKLPVSAQFKERQWTDGGRPGARQRLPRLFLLHLQSPDPAGPPQGTPRPPGAGRRPRARQSGATWQEEAAEHRGRSSRKESKAG